ncbi:MAG: cytochrome c [Roseibium sp.]|uniref:c-type cytochrome n=1 Tax=Roseibium sp. TaxID=1936156 RepID=UPI00260B31B7|nr:cytochrome c [Roseibium sp.]MCV0424121.1 cytochrome c [Roseibium sp.]
MSYPTAVEAELARRRRSPLGRIVRLLILLWGVVFLLAIILLATVAGRFMSSGPTVYADIDDHFRFGSIGAETASGLPYRVWKALPFLFPEHFDGRKDYSTFGFLYEDDRDLPIGISERTQQGVDLVWFNCAVCHTGRYRLEERGDPHLASGMPANTLDLGKFTQMVIDVSGDPKLAPEPLMAAMEEAGVGLDPLDKIIWRFAVFPRLREGLLDRAARLRPLLARQPDWNPGRVDTFNPYKVLEFDIAASELDETEVVGASDFPSIFLQGPREGMQLHWDGNNDSLAERNLSAALGAGVTPETVDHASIERVAAWLSDFEPPASPHRPDPEAVVRGRELYMDKCAACHGYQGSEGYVFEGAKLGTVELIGEIGTDPARLDSYTKAFSDLQKEKLFAGTPHAFRRFRKTDGYANAPLDGLWLRGPYLHNGSVPTLADLLEAPENRPATFLRGGDVIDGNGGFVSPACEPDMPNCFDTRLPGNSNSGHVYGVGLDATAKADLLAYLLTF